MNNNFLYIATILSFGLHAYMGSILCVTILYMGSLLCVTTILLNKKQLLNKYKGENK